MKLDRKKWRKIRTILLIVVFLAWIIYLAIVGPDTIIDKIGIGNSYLLVFLITMIGGSSSLTTFAYYATIASFASRGLNPWLLGLAAGLGVSIGDSIIYFIAEQVTNLFPQKARQKIDKITAKVNQAPKWLVPGGVFVYAGFIPLPNDIMMVALAFSHIDFRLIIIPLIVGNSILSAIIAYATQIGYSGF